MAKSKLAKMLNSIICRLEELEFSHQRSCLLQCRKLLEILAQGLEHNERLRVLRLVVPGNSKLSDRDVLGFKKSPSYLPP
jgi:hypothetical protein